jgi:hypothetical protein
MTLSLSLYGSCLDAIENADKKTEMVDALNWPKEQIDKIDDKNAQWKLVGKINKFICENAKEAKNVNVTSIKDLLARKGHRQSGLQESAPSLSCPLLGSLTIHVILHR